MYTIIRILLLGVTWVSTTCTDHENAREYRLVGVIENPDCDPDLEYWRNVDFDVAPRPLRTTPEPELKTTISECPEEEETTTETPVAQERTDAKVEEEYVDKNDEEEYVDKKDDEDGVTPDDEEDDEEDDEDEEGDDCNCGDDDHDKCEDDAKTQTRLYLRLRSLMN